MFVTTLPVTTLYHIMFCDQFALSLLDLEAQHSESESNYEQSEFHSLTQDSLVDFVVQDTSSFMADCESDAEGLPCPESVCMRNVYLTSLMPLSQQPEGFGFGAPKYNNTGFKLRKSENMYDLPAVSPPPVPSPSGILCALIVPEVGPVSPQPVFACINIQMATPTAPPPNLYRMRLVRKNNASIVLREPPPDASPSRC